MTRVDLRVNNGYRECGISSVTGVPMRLADERTRIRTPVITRGNLPHSLYHTTHIFFIHINALKPDQCLLAVTFLSLKTAPINIDRFKEIILKEKCVLVAFFN